MAVQLDLSRTLRTDALARDVKSGADLSVQITSVEVSSLSSPSESTATEADTQLGGSDTHVPPTTESSTQAQVLAILDVIKTYGVAYERTNHWEGLENFIPKVKKQVEASEPVRLLLPGFPFKSPNARDKVLGTLPDLGEELALAHLNGLCSNIATVYGHGAEVHILSDGLVYNGMWTLLTNSSRC
jgi:hypothetical protein